MLTAEKVISSFKSMGCTVERYQDLHVIDGTNYVNVRHKSEASYHKKSKRYEFGIPLIHWQRYLTLEKEGKRVYSIVIEVKTSTVYYARLKNILPNARVYAGDLVDTGGTVFLPRDAYEVKRS